MAPNPRPPQEVLLIQKSKEGDHDAFRRLYDLNAAGLFRFMVQFSRDEHQVQDWVQRAFIKAFEHLASFDGISLFATWLFKLAINEMRMDYRRAKILSFVPIPEDEIAVAAGDDDVFEWNMAMKLLLGELDETKRAVFILYEIEGFSHSEIAELLQIRESTSRTILTRTKQFLRKRWEEERTAR